MAGFKSERVAGFKLECLAGFVGIRSETGLHHVRQVLATISQALPPKRQ
jgi:hypothetical protein